MFFMPIVRLVVTITSTGSHRDRVEVAAHGVLHRESKQSHPFVERV